MPNPTPNVSPRARTPPGRAIVPGERPQVEAAGIDGRGNNFHTIYSSTTVRASQARFAARAPPAHHSKYSKQSIFSPRAHTNPSPSPPPRQVPPSAAQTGRLLLLLGCARRTRRGPGRAVALPIQQQRHGRMPTSNARTAPAKRPRRAGRVQLQLLPPLSSSSGYGCEGASHSKPQLGRLREYTGELGVFSKGRLLRGERRGVRRCGPAAARPPPRRRGGTDAANGQLADSLHRARARNTCC